MPVITELIYTEAGKCPSCRHTAPLNQFSLCRNCYRCSRCGTWGEHRDGKHRGCTESLEYYKKLLRKKVY